MSWVRVDDGFTANSKIVQLTDGEFRCWFRLLCHCAKSQDPTVDSAARREVAGLSNARVSRFIALGLLDYVEGNKETCEIHDWAKYLPKDSPTERQARWRARIAQNGASTTASTPASTNTDDETSTEMSTRAQVRADSRPVLSQEEDLKAVALDVAANDNERTASEIESLDELAPDIQALAPDLEEMTW